MNYLAIDASTELASVAVSVGLKIFCEERDTPRQHTPWLLPVIEQLLAAAQCQLTELDGIVFGRGPGSFTGLRIACAVAKGLAYAHDVPLFPVSSLAAIACHVFQTEPNLAPNTQVLAMMDARMQEVYWEVFADPSQGSREQVGPIDQVVIPADAPVIIAGVGLDTYPKPESWSARQLQQHTVFPHAKSMIHLVQSGNIEPVAVAQAVPMYIRNPYGETCG